ncbi:MAG: hypothetical protein A3F43_00685, partial [Gammaproteobacteria bacterium RIFCSPHIGHO2_12_FULL_42_10]
MKLLFKKMGYSALTTLAISAATHAYADTTAASSAAVSPAERAKIESVVHDYLLAKPEIIVEAMQILQNRQFEQAKQAMQKTEQNAPRYAHTLFNAPANMITGNPKGSVTLVEFFDYQCPHCVDVVPTINNAIKANADLRVIYREWPIRGPVSEFASRAAIAAAAQGKYFTLHQALLTAGQPLTQDSVLDIAKKAGLNVAQLQKDMDDPQTDSQIKINVKLAQDLKLFGTPAFFIGRTNATGGVTY